MSADQYERRYAAFKKAQFRLEEMLFSSIRERRIAAGKALGKRSWVEALLG